MMILLVLVSLLAVYLYLSRKLDSSIFDTKLLLLITSLFVYTGILSIFVIVGGLFTSFSFFDVTLLTTLVVYILLIYEQYLIKTNKNDTTLRRKPITTQDIASLLVSVAVMSAIVLVPIVRHHLSNNPSNVLLTLTSNVDGEAHLGMFNSYLHTSNVRTQNLPAEKSYDAQFNTMYPSAWHGSNAILARSVNTPLKPGVDSLKYFAFINIFWFGVLIYFFTRYSFILLRLLLDKDSKKLLSTASIVLGSLTFIFLFCAPIFSYSFFTYTPQLIIALLFMMNLHQLNASTIFRSSKSNLGILILLCGLCMVSWILLMPIFIISTLIYLLFLYATDKKLFNFNNYKNEVATNLPIYILTLVCIVSQLIRVSQFDQDSGGITHLISANGGVPMYDFTQYALLISGLLAFVYTCIYKLKLFYRSALVLATTTLMYTLLIMILQLAITGSLHYYYYKSLLLIPMILSPVCVAIFSYYIVKLFHKDILLSITLLVLAPCLILQFMPLNRDAVYSLSGNRPVSTAITKDVFEQIKKSQYNDKHIVIYMLGSQSSDIATMYANASRPKSYCFYKLRTKFAISNIDKAISSINNDPTLPECAGYEVEILVDPDLQASINLDTHQSYKVSFLPAL